MFCWMPSSVLNLPFWASCLLPRLHAALPVHLIPPQPPPLPHLTSPLSPNCLHSTYSCREPGWAGVAVAPGQPSQAAVARHFARDVTLFDGGMAVRSLHTMYCPTAVQLLSTSLAAGPQGGPLVAVTEGPQLSIWDVRGAGRGARVAKLSPGPHHGHLFCIAASDNNGLPLIGG